MNIINPSISSKSGLNQAPYPEISFVDSWLDEKIKQETALKFYDCLFAVINDE
jgi:hypothetical protein